MARLSVDLLSSHARLVTERVLAIETPLDGPFLTDFLHAAQAASLLHFKGLFKGTRVCNMLVRTPTALKAVRDATVA